MGGTVRDVVPSVAGKANLLLKKLQNNNNKKNIGDRKSQNLEKHNDEFEEVPACSGSQTAWLHVVLWRAVGLLTWVTS